MGDVIGILIHRHDGITKNSMIKGRCKVHTFQVVVEADSLEELGDKIQKKKAIYSAISGIPIILN